MMRVSFEFVENVYKEAKGRSYPIVPHQTSVKVFFKAAAMSNDNLDQLRTVQARALYANFTMTMVEIGTSTSIYL
jgi:hypothetical protein